MTTAEIDLLFERTTRIAISASPHPLDKLRYDRDTDHIKYINSDNKKSPRNIHIRTRYGEHKQVVRSRSRDNSSDHHYNDSSERPFRPENTNSSTNYLSPSTSR